MGATTVKNQEKVSRKVKTMRYREVLPKILSNKAEIQHISSCNKDGRMHFIISINDLGITVDEYKEYICEIFSPFVADLLGELLIRENLDLFVPHLTQFNNSEFVHAISGGENRKQHKRFGMESKRGSIYFHFQASLLHDILTEDFRDVVS